MQEGLHLYLRKTFCSTCCMQMTRRFMATLTSHEINEGIAIMQNNATVFDWATENGLNLMSERPTPRYWAVPETWPCYLMVCLKSQYMVPQFSCRLSQEPGSTNDTNTKLAATDNINHQ